MGRRELREELQATWMVYVPRKTYESRAQRRRNLAVARAEARRKAHAVASAKAREGVPVWPQEQALAAWPAVWQLPTVVEDWRLPTVADEEQPKSTMEE